MELSVHGYAYFVFKLIKSHFPLLVLSSIRDKKIQITDEQWKALSLCTYNNNDVIPRKQKPHYLIYTNSNHNKIYWFFFRMKLKKNDQQIVIL